MQKKIPLIYMILALLSLYFLLFIGITFTTFKYTVSGYAHTQIINNFVDVSKDAHVQELHTKLPNVLNSDTCLNFFTAHQNVEIFIDGKLIYSYVNGNNLFGHSPGHSWHFVRIPKYAQGKDLEVYLQSPYLASAEITPLFRLGSPLTLFIEMLKENLFSFSICLIMILIGILLILYWLSIRNNSIQIDSSLFYLGLVAITYGLWALNDSRITIFILNNQVITSFASFMLLMLIPFPFILFIRNFYHNKDSIFWTILCFLSIGNILICTTLQILNIADFKETLWITHIFVIICTVSCLIFTLSEIRKYSISDSLKLNLACLLFAMLGSACSLVFFYLGIYNHNTFAYISFLVYIVIPAIVSIRQINLLLKRSEEAEFYHKMAYYDHLTKLLNRNAYAEDIEKLNATKNYPTVIICDLNNLKQCNDIFGHEAGDYYIQDAASIIRSVFSPYGKCYRTGGDEFCILLNNIYRGKCEKLIQHMNASWNDYHDLPEAFHANIACGYAYFDSFLDHDFNDTIKRADARMYVDKQTSKQ